MPLQFHFKTSSLGDYLLLAEPGWMIISNNDTNDGISNLRGMHGYNPIYKNMHGIFYARGKDLKSGLQIPAFENIHIYPLICELLEISAYSGKDDAPEGEIRILQNILLK